MSNSKATEWVERSRSLMAWAVSAHERKATYIGSLRLDQTGLACDCICPACGGRLQAVNAGKSLEELIEGQSLRPHFRHHTGQQQDACLVKMSQIVALQLLMQEQVIHLPEHTARWTVTGASGQKYTGTASSNAFTLSIQTREWVDEHEARITTPDGRVVWVRLLGAYGRGQESKGDAVITIHVTDPEVSTWPADKILEHAQLTGEWMCWEKHWDDAQLIQQAQDDAVLQAQHWCDYVPQDLEFADGLTMVQRSESVLHWLIKQILESAQSITVPGFKETFSRTMPEDYEVFERVHWASRVYGISNVRLEYRLQGVVPDVLCSAVSGDDSPLELMIEVAVTHRVDQAKAARIRALGLACLEIDATRLGKSGRVTIDELRTMVLTKVEGKHWIMHPGIEAMKLAAKDRLEQKYRSAAQSIRERDARVARWEAMCEEELLFEYLDQLRLIWQNKALAHSIGEEGVEGTLVDELASRNFKMMDSPQLVAPGGVLWMVDAIVNGSYRASPLPLLERAMSAQWYDQGDEFVRIQEYATVVGMAIAANSSPITASDRQRMAELREVMRQSLQNGDITYARPVVYDRALALLFPQIRERLESGKGTQTSVQKASLERLIQANRRAKDAAEQQQSQEKLDRMNSRYADINRDLAWVAISRGSHDVTSTLMRAGKVLDHGEIASEFTWRRVDWRLVLRSAWIARENGLDLSGWMQTQQPNGQWDINARLRILEVAGMIAKKGLDNPLDIRIVNSLPSVYIPGRPGIK